MRNKLVITEYTDPLCNWCYAADPNIRKIMYLNPDVEMHNILGLMIRDYHQLTGYEPGAEERFKELMKHMTKHQGDVPAIANLPHSSKAFAEMKPENMSSYLASVAVEAMKILDEDSANHYIRRIRETLHSDGKQITEEDVLLELAKEFPVDQKQFKKIFTDGSAERALDEDISKTRNFGVQGFPTFYLEYKGRHDIFSGYMPYEGFAKRLERLTGGDVILKEKAFTEENVLDFINQFERVAEGELELTFTVSNDDVNQMVNQMVNQLKEADKITIEPSDVSYFVRARKKEQIHFCDPETGICSFNWQ